MKSWCDRRINLFQPYQSLRITSTCKLLNMGCSKAEVIPALSSSPIHLSHGRTDHLFLILREGTLPVVLLALLHQLDALTVVLHGVVDLVGVGVLTFISATEFLPALHTCSALAEVELLVSILPDLRRCSITGIARVIHMTACHCPKPTSLIVEDEEAGQHSEAPRHPEIPRSSCTQDTKAAGTLAVQIHPWSI